MKRSVLHLLLISFLAINLSSCATIFGGPVDKCQMSKPKDGETQRHIRTGALVADILLFAPGLIVDFATGAIYRPCTYYESKTR